MEFGIQMKNSNPLIRAKNCFRYVSRTTVFIAFIMIIGTIQGSEGREWHSQRYQLVSELNARNNYLWIDGKQVKSDGKSSNSATFFSLSNTLNDNFEEIVILEGFDGRVIAIDQTSDAVIVKTPLRTISSYNSLHQVTSAEPDILFRKIARSEGSALCYFQSLLQGRRTLGFNQSGDALPASQVIPGSEESLFSIL